MKFEIGKLVSTRPVHERMDKDLGFAVFIQESLNRYINCDWGNSSIEDALSNDEAVKNGEDRIFATYKQPKTDTTIWIITEWDRSATTVLFPSDY